jgi:hypothetical protein
MLGPGVRVLVVGAGIAGLAAARTLRDWGAAVEIVERQLDPPGEGTGIFPLGNAVCALDTLEVGWPNALSTSDGSGRPTTAAERCSRSTSTSCGTASDPVSRCPGRMHRVLLAGAVISLYQEVERYRGSRPHLFGAPMQQGDIAAEMERARVGFRHPSKTPPARSCGQVPTAPSGPMSSCCFTCFSGTYWSTIC